MRSKRIIALNDYIIYLGHENHMLSTELLLEFSDQADLHLLELLLEGNGHPDDDGTSLLIGVLLKLDKIIKEDQIKSDKMNYQMTPQSENRQLTVTPTMKSSRSSALMSELTSRSARAPATCFSISVGSWPLGRISLVTSVIVTEIT